MNDYTYEAMETPMGEQQIKRTDGSGLETWIPVDPGNADYAAYLASLEAQTPAPKAK